jgi:hypothetical protein
LLLTHVLYRYNWCFDRLYTLKKRTAAATEAARSRFAACPAAGMLAHGSETSGHGRDTILALVRGEHVQAVPGRWLGRLTQRAVGRSAKWSGPERAGVAMTRTLECLSQFLCVVPQ